MSLVSLKSITNRFSTSHADDHVAKREHRIKLAVATSIVSKIATMAVQILAMPLAVKALGVDLFGVYAMLAASLNWMSMASIGIGPGLTLGIANAAVKGEHKIEARYFSSAFYMIFTICTVLGIALFAASCFYPVYHIFGPKYIHYSATISSGAYLLIAMLLAQLLLTVFDAAQAGYQEQYISNTWAIVGNTFSLVALFVVAYCYPSVSGMIIAVSGAPVLASMCNGIRLIGVARPYLRPKWIHFHWPTSKMLIYNGLAFSIVIGASFLNHQFSTIMVGRLGGARVVATYSIMMQIIILALGMVSMFMKPLWPALTDAVARHDAEWAQKIYYKALRYSMIYATLVGGGIAIVGRPVLHLWFHNRIHLGVGLQVGIGIYFIIAVWEYVHYNVLIGLNNLWPSAICMTLRSILLVSTVSFVYSLYGSAGVAFDLCVTALIVSAWSLPLVTQNTLHKLMLRAKENENHNRATEAVSGRMQVSVSANMAEEMQ